MSPEQWMAIARSELEQINSEQCTCYNMDDFIKQCFSKSPPFTHDQLDHLPHIWFILDYESSKYKEWSFTGQFEIPFE
jgi:hypothetical protein